METNDLLDGFGTIQENYLNAKKEWTHFIKSGGISSSSTLNAEILSSWNRCRIRNLDPYDTEPKILPREEWIKRRKGHEDMIRIIEPICREIAELAYDGKVRFNYYDADLYLLDHFGHVADNIALLPPKLPLGTSLKEVDAGTNAVSQSKLLEKPVQLSGFEHYNVSRHMLTSAATSIRDMSGVIVAAVSVDVYLKNQTQKDLLGMLTAMRRSIKYVTHQKFGYNYEELESIINKEIVDNIPDAFAVVNGGGIVLAMNQTANRILNEGKLNPIGQACGTLWGDRNPFVEVIRCKKAIYNKNVVFKTKGTIIRLNGTVKPIFSTEGEMIAIHGLFKETRDSGIAQNKVSGKTRYCFDDMIGQSETMLQAIRLAKETARMDCNILLQGETGTGKELFAQSIHNASLYREGPFLGVNCSAIPENLLESELFGYEGGAFTSAKKEGKVGKFTAARGGTVFLDEINTMPLSMQTKLLRAIQEKYITKVGGIEEIPINVRIITASNVDLWEMVKQGKFREDLFYRINVIMISLPPLRERTGDIPLLISFVTGRLSGDLCEIQIGEAVLEILKQYSWPGNVRELENVIERSVILAKARGSTTVMPEDVMGYRGIHECIYQAQEQENSEMSLPQHSESRLDAFEREEIKSILSKNRGNISKTAKELRIARNTLYKKIERYQISFEFQ